MAFFTLCRIFPQWSALQSIDYSRFPNALSEHWFERQLFTTSSEEQTKHNEREREREREKREAEREKEIAREGWGSPTGDVGRRGNACSQSHGLNIETACLERQEPYPHEPNTVPAVTKI